MSCYRQTALCAEPRGVGQKEPKGIVQQILRRVNTKLKEYVLINWGTTYFFYFKGTPSQEEPKTLFSGLKICKMALSNQIDFLVFFTLHKMTYHNFINCPLRWPYAATFRKLTFQN